VLDADVVALQEVDGVAAARRVFDPERYAFHFTSEADQRQRTGFAFRRGLAVEPQPDLVELAVSGSRRGADILVRAPGAELRLLSVHLKSGCRVEPERDPGKACAILREQFPVLGRWIEARAREAVPFAVAGDFNRSWSAGDPLWVGLDDGDPPGVDLADPARGLRPRCWYGAYAAFVDHILLGAGAARWLVPGSFQEVVYHDADRRARAKLSDHCPIAVAILPGGKAATTPAARREARDGAGGDPAPPRRARPDRGSAPPLERAARDPAPGARYDSALARPARRRSSRVWSWTKYSNIDFIAQYVQPRGPSNRPRRITM